MDGAGRAHVRAIVGRALRLRAAEFSGGDQTVKRRLERLGFEVRQFPLLPWIREELLLACEVLAANDWKLLDDRSRQVIQLSELLRTETFHPADQHGPDFRTPQAVVSKQDEIAASHRNGAVDARAEDVVVRDFLARPTEMYEQATRLQARLLNLRPEQVKPPDVQVGRIPVPVVFDVPVEAHRTVTFTVSAAKERQASRVEAELAKRYREQRASAGHAVTGKVILLPREATRLRIDLYDVDRAELTGPGGSACPARHPVEVAAPSARGDRDRARSVQQ